MVLHRPPVLPLRRVLVVPMRLLVVMVLLAVSLMLLTVLFAAHDFSPYPEV
jgi:hypothetical protein